MPFEFFDPGILNGGDFELIRFATLPPDSARGLVPGYDFRIRVNGSELIGQVNLRIGITDHIMLYAGNLGYKVDPDLSRQAVRVARHQAITSHRQAS